MSRATGSFWTVYGLAFAIAVAGFAVAYRFVVRHRHERPKKLSYFHFPAIHTFYDAAVRPVWGLPMTGRVNVFYLCNAGHLKPLLNLAAALALRAFVRAVVCVSVWIILFRFGVDRPERVFFLLLLVFKPKVFHLAFAAFFRLVIFGSFLPPIANSQFGNPQYKYAFGFFLHPHTLGLMSPFFGPNCRA